MMPTPKSIGSAKARPGEIQYGKWEAFRHPTGQVEFLPVVIAQGGKDGPCLWLTAGIHGPEHTGPVVVHDLITPHLVAEIRGPILPTPPLTPVGLRMILPQPHPESKDPNRL